MWLESEKYAIKPEKTLQGLMSARGRLSVKNHVFSETRPQTLAIFNITGNAGLCYLRLVLQSAIARSEAQIVPGGSEDCALQMT